MPEPRGPAQVRSARGIGASSHSVIAAVALGLLVVLGLTPSPTHAQSNDWSGSFALAHAWVEPNGNADSFRTQYDLQTGFFLEDFELDYAPENGAQSFSLSAWGFGSAIGSEVLLFDAELSPKLRLDLEYRNNQSFFALGGEDPTSRTDDWTLSRWRLDLTWLISKKWSLSLLYRNVQREGSVHRPQYGLNELYPSGLHLNDSMSETGLRVESDALPVHFVFEQAFADYKRQTSPFAAGSTAISNPNDPDLYADAGSTAVDTQEVPTSRLTASWGNPTWEGVVTALYSSADYDSDGSVWQTFAIGGGSMGTTSFVDELVGSSQMDSVAGAVRLGFHLGRTFTVGVSGNYRDSTADTKLLGRRFLHTINPLGQEFEIEAPIDNTGRYGFTDQSGRLTLTWKPSAFSMWAGGHTGQREVEWQLTDGSESTKTDRDSSGWLVGAGWSGGGIDASLEYEDETFERYVFRTDPEKVDRLTARLRTRIKGGFQLGLQGRTEQATNPSEVSGMDRESGAYGAFASWASSSGTHSIGLNVDNVDLDSTVDIMLPDGQPEASVYDLELLTSSLYYRLAVGFMRLDLSATYLKDDGQTWPVDAWNAGGRIELDGPIGTRYAFFVQYWNYDEVLADIDDFSATRYGLSIGWSFNQ